MPLHKVPLILGLLLVALAIRSFLAGGAAGMIAGWMLLGLAAAPFFAAALPPGKPAPRMPVAHVTTNEWPDPAVSIWARRIAESPSTQKIQQRTKG
ncbi:MAG: hypothetical protein ACYDDF_14795 [Thermoplasmatota archaeon]